MNECNKQGALMNSRTNRMFFIIIALLGSVKNSYVNSNQLAIKGTHVRRPIKGVKTFESPNPFAVLGEMNDEPTSSTSLSDASLLKRLKQKRRRKTESGRTIKANVTENKSDESLWSIPSINEIPKELVYFVAALKLLKGVQGIPEECQNNSSLSSCYNEACNEVYSDEYSKGLIDACLTWGIVFGAGLICLGYYVDICSYRSCKSISKCCTCYENRAQDNNV